MEVHYPVPSLKPTAEASTAAVEIIQGLESAWNHHDMKQFVSYVTDDCQWVNVVGMFWDGKEAVYQAHEGFHQTIFKTVQYHSNSASLRQITPDVVIGVVKVTMDQFTTPDGKVVPEGPTRLTYVMVKRDGKWKLCSAQNTPIDPVAAKFNPGG